jgi:type IV pilus assembly protein PilY1
MDTQLKIMTKSVMAALLVAAGSAHAQSSASTGPVTVSDNFTLGANQQNWTTSGGACLTAGGATLPTGVTAATSLIPTCSTSSQLGGYANSTYPNGALASGHLDPGGYGALRLTNAVGNAAGSIVWNSTFPSSSGISITFTAVSYDGNSYSGGDGGHNGADGLSFFLMDAGVTPHKIGQYGGSLGYSCAQAKGGGATGGYIGLGIDEYGNFLNSGDNTATGVTNTTSSGAGQFQGNRIGVRGAGVVNWQQLSSLYPSFYPTTLSSTQQTNAIYQTCSTGILWNYSGSSPVQACNNFAQLNSAYPSYYPTSLTSSQQTAAVSNTCNTGNVWNYNQATPAQACSLTFAGLHSQYPSYYPNSLTATQQAAAVANSCSTASVWDYSGSNTSPDYSTTSNPYNIGACYSYSQLVSINRTYYPSTVSASLQASAVSNTCSSGDLYYYHSGNFSDSGYSSPQPNPISLSGVAIAAPPVPVMDYAVVQYTNSSGVTVPARSVLTVPIANESAGSRNAYGTHSGATAYTYNLSITSNGLLSLSYTSNANSTTGTTTVATNWPIFSSNGTAPTNFTFGFAASTGGGTNVHEIACFQAAPAEDTDTSASVNAVEAGQVRTNTAVYLAYYHTHDWWGQMTSTSLVLNSAGTQLNIGASANWDASCMLTGDTTGTTLPGGTCSATGSTSDAAVPTPTNRVMLSYDPVAQTGVAFESTSGLTSAQLNTLGTGDSLATQRVAYLRGDRSNEINASTGAGLFRARISVLGDIVNSSPTWVGGPTEFYPTSTWTDLLYPTAVMPESANTYGNFQTTAGTRLNVVYVGSNDGFLHGFEAGVYNPTTGGVTAPGASTTNNGQEVLAYMPGAIVQTIHNSTTPTLDYSSAIYGHNYFVDGTPGVGSLYYNNAWHTWLVAGMGAGASGIYALDVTSPSAFQESNAASLVIGEWTPSSSALGSNASNLGNVYGIPKFARFHTGNWGFVFGNGYNSTGGNPGVFVAQVNQSSGAVTFTFLPIPSSGTPNAIFSAVPVDLDGDGVTDYIYAGDLQGNIWRWDVTPNVTWSTTPIKVFQTASGQPITTQLMPAIATTASGGKRLLIDFGTGEQIPNGTNPNSNNYASGTQALYGIWDGNMSTWNSLPNVSASNQFISYPASVTGSSGTVTISQPYTVKASDLLTQSTTVSSSYVASSGTVNYRSITAGVPCWADGSSSCATYGVEGQYGWTYALTGAANNNAPEQVVFNPILAEGYFIVNTFIAQAQQQCTTNNPTGWTIALNAVTGGEVPTSVFPTNQTGVNQAAVQTSPSGSPTVVNSAVGTFLVTGTTSTSTNGNGSGSGFNQSGAAQVGSVTLNLNNGSRVNWIQIK